MAHHTAPNAGSPARGRPKPWATSSFRATDRNIADHSVTAVRFAQTGEYYVPFCRPVAVLPVKRLRLQRMQTFAVRSHQLAFVESKNSRIWLERWRRYAKN